MLFKNLENKISVLAKEPLPEERKRLLQALIDYINRKVIQQKKTNLIFICTHNSRRSHISQVWAQVAAHYYNIKNVNCYSGGTETTALHPMVIKTLENTGFEITKKTDDNNPVYHINYGENEPYIVGFSKNFNHPINPQTDFAAIMTCAQADAECPFIAGAEERIPVKYDDPKAFDNTNQQAEAYGKRSNQIAIEMLYVFSQIKS